MNPHNHPPKINSAAMDQLPTSSETPRSDSFQHIRMKITGTPFEEYTAQREMDFARQLERELANAKAQIEEYEAEEASRRCAGGDYAALIEANEGRLQLLQMLTASQARERVLRSALEQIWNHGRGGEALPGRPDEHPECSWIKNYNAVKEALNHP